jgi:hypothetical protein
MEQWQQFMPGIDRVVGFYHVDESEEIQGVEWLNTLGSAHLSLFNPDHEVQQSLLQVSKERQAFQWQRADMLPFANQSARIKGQLDLFSEQQYLVLLIRLDSDVPNCKDLFYVFFRDDKSNFGIIDDQSALDTTQKSIIGKLASNFAIITINTYRETQKRENAFKKRTQNVLQSRQDEINTQNSDLRDWKSAWLMSYLSEISQRDSVNYVLSEQAEQHLLKSTSSFEILKGSIEQSIIYICELYTIAPGDDVIIDECYLQIEVPKLVRKEEKPVEQLPVSRLGKTMSLLDRLEEASVKVIDSGLTLTSAEVGSHMQKKISAPAITDALRKNKVRIFQLFEQYPHRWPVIRQHFKPIINLNSKWEVI